MSRNIPETLRRAVAERAAYRCEYCRHPEADSFFKFQVDHIVSLKHGGSSRLDNLAFACPLCNSHKGTDLGTFLGDEDVLVRLFYPRKQDWFQHFDVADGAIQPKTDVGAATVKLLALNHPNRVLERLDLITAGLYP